MPPATTREDSLATILHVKACRAVRGTRFRGRWHKLQVSTSPCTERTGRHRGYEANVDLQRGHVECRHQQNGVERKMYGQTLRM